MQYRPLSELTKLPGNPRTITKEDMATLKQSIQDNPDYFEARPLILSNRTGELVILGGNQRFEAAHQLKLDKVPTHLIEGLTEAREQEIVIRDNVANGEWDWDVIANEWSELPLEDWGLELPVAPEDIEPEEDEAPAVSPNPPKSEIGKVYQLGRHRVMCGDSTDFGQVSDLMNGEQADMVFTDPPYGVDYVGKTKDKLKIQNDVNTNIWAEVLPNYVANTKPGAPFYVCCPAGNNFKDFFLPFEEHLYLSSTIIWVKNTLVMGHGDYHYQHEPILYGWNKEGPHKYYGDRKQTSLWNVDRPTSSKEHPTMKPIALMVKALQNSSKQDDVVLDLFLGSGSTLIACEQTNRTCYGMELDPQYVDVIRKRYAIFVSENKKLPDEWEDLTPEIVR